MDVEAARLRAEADAHPLRLPVNRRLDDRHRTVDAGGLTVWYTIQVAGRRRIHEVRFERSDRPPGDEECARWLAALLPGRTAEEEPGLPGALTRRFEWLE
jgi:hypothetical protein